MKKIFQALTILAVALVSCKDNNVATKAVIPTVTTVPITNITTNSATGGGNITSDGGGAILEKGVIWGPSANPLRDAAGVANTSDGVGTGPYVSMMSAFLLPGTTFHVRAFATNQAGIGYGSDLVFTTLSLSLPTLTTTAVSAITSTSATSGGNISSDGGTTVGFRGICWSTTLNPTTTVNAGINAGGTGPGSFVNPMTGLAPTTLYHVRAFAQNGAGLAYGNDVTFTTN